jgi:UDP-N-acetylglucosamine 3-dehydrogenase
MIKAAVIGVGSMGRNHARIYADMKEVQLCALADLDRARVPDYGVPIYFDYKQMLDEQKPDIVSIAVPTSAHYAIASVALKHCHVLLEKPITDTLEKAIKLVAQAEEQENVLMIGHIERFNPAIMAIKDLIDQFRLGDIYHISTIRCGPSPRRIRDVGILVDLATHDFDLMRWLIGCEAQRASAHLGYHQHGDQEDQATGWIQFETGIVGTFQVDWLSAVKIRTLTIVAEHGTIHADLLTQHVGFWDRYKEPAHVESIGVGCHEPLRREIEMFIAVAQGQGPIPVTARDGAAALNIAMALNAE